ncbi:MAG: polysaccharide biosynthesis C-terminal domain-containing protein [Clostridia bacterium]|nr:polysaccharide biosynthesis C-terminal domain-containing protein [Clostridia bacterium]
MKDNMLLRMTRNDYSFTVVTKVLSVLIGLVAGFFSAQLLGVALTGNFGYIDALLTTVAVVASFGLYQTYPFHKKNNEPDALRKFLDIFSLQFVLYTAIGLTLAVVLRSFALAAVCFIAPIQVLANQLSYMIMVEDVKHKNVVFLTARTTNTVIIVLAYFLLVSQRETHITLMVALSLVVVGDIITVVMVTRRLGRFGNPLRAEMKFLRKIFGFGCVAMLNTLLLTVNYRMGTMMLGWMGATNTELGYYTTGISLAGFGWIISDAFREVLFSRTVRKDAVANVVFSLKINFYITLVAIAGIAMFGRTAILILRGAAFLPAYRVTVILFVGVLSMSYFKLIGTLFLADGRKTAYLVLLSASALVNIVANWITIPRWGIDGAAVSSVLSYTVAGAVFLLYFLKTYKVPMASLFVFEKGEIPGLIARIRGR